MPQLHFYVPDNIANKVKQRAQETGLSTSKYLATLVVNEVGQEAWPENFFEEVVGGWQGEQLQRPSQGQFDPRDLFDPISTSE